MRVADDDRFSRTSSSVNPMPSGTSSSQGRNWERRPHYIHLDVASEKPDPFAAKFGDRNVLAAIDRFRKVLKDRRADPIARKEALLFLVHFVGDMHQPLHCAARNDDKGGNRVPVLYLG